MTHSHEQKRKKEEAIKEAEHHRMHSAVDGKKHPSQQLHHKNMADNQRESARYSKDVFHGPNPDEYNAEEAEG